MASAPLLSWTILVLTSAMICGFMYDDPCNLMPPGPNKGHTLNVSVPQQCKNGTFWWNYPQGRINLQFLQPGFESYSICIKDYLGGGIFTMFDVTSVGHVPMKNLTRGSEQSCTESHMSDIKIEFNAPDAMVYMGEVAYCVKM